MAPMYNIKSNKSENATQIVMNTLLFSLYMCGMGLGGGGECVCLVMPESKENVLVGRATYSTKGIRVCVHACMCHFKKRNLCACHSL